MTDKKIYPTPRVLQVYNILKDGKSHDFNKIVKSLNCNRLTVMVYLSELRKKWGAEIVLDREGRVAETYKMTNAGDLAPKMVRNPKRDPANKAARKAAVKKKADGVTRIKRVATLARRAGVDISKQQPAAVEGEVPTLDIEEDTADDVTSAARSLGIAVPSDRYTE